MQDKQYIMCITRDSKAFVLPFPARLDLPATREVRGVIYENSGRTKTTPDYTATIYLQQNANLKIDEFADPVDENATSEVEEPAYAQNTTIYGASDDLIEFEGGYTGEVGYYSEEPALIVVSDGTVLSIKYGKSDRAIWSIDVLRRGTAFRTLDVCENEDAPIYSDVVTLQGKIQWIYVAKDYEKAE